MNKILKSLTLATGLLLSVGMFAGCSDDSSTTTNTETETANHLNFGVYKYSDSVDPITNVNSSWCGVRYGITECLFKFDEAVVAQPALAESIAPSEDYTSWTITLKDGLKFSNGNDVNASAVVASLERLYKETDASQGGTGNSNPEGYLVYESIVADDAAGTVTITCANPTPNMDGILSYPYFAIVDVTSEDVIIGTGPYAIADDNTGVSMELVANENYREDVPYETVTIMYIDDNSTKAMALQSGNIDVVENIASADALAQVEADGRFFIDTAAGVRTANTYFNFKNEGGNEALRQAIQYALDDTTMCEITTGGMYTEGISVLPSSLAYGYETLVDPFAFNVDMAIETLDNAGIVDTDGDGWRELDGVNIDLDYVAYASRNLNDYAEAICLQLEAIGIKTTLNLRDYDTAMALYNAGEFDLIASNSITVGVGDPQDFMGNWYTGNSASYGYYSNAEYDALYEELMVTFDEERRVEIITELQQILIDDAAAIVHGYYNSRLISNPEVVTGATIATIDYYWLTTDMKPVD